MKTEVQLVVSSRVANVEAALKRDLSSTYGTRGLKIVSSKLVDRSHGEDFYDCVVEGDAKAVNQLKAQLEDVCCCGQCEGGGQ